MALSLEKIGKTVAGEHHLIDVDLTLEPGTINVVLGHTGAGKTSLLRMIAGLDRPTTGAIRQGGVDITRRPARERSVALVYQQFINYPSLTVRENIASPLRLRGVRDREPRVLELARVLRIAELLDRWPGELSGGQQQRVAIARALAKGAEIVLLDEPLVNLDYKLREDLRDELRALLGTVQAGGKPATVVYATTDPAEALALGGRTIVVHQGRVLQHAPTLEVYHRPASVAAARVFSDPPMNIFDGVVRAGAIEVADQLRIATAGTHLAAIADGPYRFGIRASDCRLGGAGDGVAVRARVELSEISGSETFVYLRAIDERRESGGRGPAGLAGGEGDRPLSIDERRESGGRGPAGLAGGEGDRPLSIDERRESGGRGPAGLAGGEGDRPLSIDERRESGGRGPAGLAGGEGDRPLSIDERSESGGAQYIVQQDGVYHHQLDDELTFYLDPGRLLAFARDGEQALVASYRP